MSHALAALQVVVGAVLALLTYGPAASADYLNQFVAFGAVFALGLFVAVHGLFRGIETAVATAAASEEDPSPTE